ncbi:patched family-domain-containing protein [Pisolithus thermaeus]|nr:patched family-domain-containing protein [Pisolithus thermaeus]
MSGGTPGEALGQCAMRGSCGSKGWFGQQLPCPYDGPPLEPEGRKARDLLYAQEQVETLRDSLAQAEPIISSCPACRNNFMSFFCSFTCSPRQGSFLNVTETQKSSTGETAVKSRFAPGFYDTTNGGGAKTYTDFLKFLGDEKDIGSVNPYNNDLSSRYVCPELPYIPPPGQEPTCHVGPLTSYALAVVSFLLGYVIQVAMRRRREKRSERLVLSSDAAHRTRNLVGAASLSQADRDDSFGAHSSDSRRLGRGASLLDPIATSQPRQYHLNNLLGRKFYQLGLLAASSPFLTFALVFTAIGLLNLGWKRFAIETDPARLWVAPDSESKLQKEFFDEHFGPFYRAQQIFVTKATDAYTAPENVSLASADVAVLSFDHLKYWLAVESDIRELRSSPNGYGLADVCFKPAGPSGACVVQSIGAWFANDLSDYDEESWKDRVLHCANSPVDCLPDFQQPLGPQYVLGGVPENRVGEKSYLEAEAMVVTYVVSDSLDSKEQAKAMEWEQALKEYLMELSDTIDTDAGLHIAFSTGVSLEQEISKSTNTDVKIVVLSYLAMFLYVSLALGNWEATDEGVVASLTHWARNLPALFVRSSVRSSSISVESRTSRVLPRLPRSLFVNSRMCLGLFGIGLVVLSVSSSVGLLSLLGVKTTLIIAEVIPFLVLAVGVDNVFILVDELDRQNLRHGPSAVQSSAAGPRSPSQSHRSPLDSTWDNSIDTDSLPSFRPAEERVAMALAKMGPSILLSSVTETVAFGLGALVPMPAVRNFALYAAGSVLLNAILQVTVFVSALSLDLRRAESNVPSHRGPGGIARFIRRHYAPFLLQPAVKGFLGLDQRLALPSESYLNDYFDCLEVYLDIGPPVYFVVHDTDVTQRPNQQRLCGRFTTCDDTSVANVLEAERKRPDSSFISQPTASWIDDFLKWLDPTYGNVLSCPEEFRATVPTLSIRQGAPMEHHNDRTPRGEEFMRYLQQWLISPTNEECPLAGRASYGSALSLDDEGAEVVASHFRTMHSPLRSQADFINSFAAAHRIADDISDHLGLKVFPYSLHYVFFDQYAHIIAIAQEILGLGLAAVLIITALLLGSWRTGTIVTGVVALTVVNVMGVMAVWISFCAHVARAFMNPSSDLYVDQPAGQKERDTRMWAALADVGSSVLSGITFTKLIGVSVLALTRSRLLEIYYFRMWFTLIVAGALHGLVLLPVVLSLAGGPGFAQETDEDWMAKVIRNDEHT